MHKSLYNMRITIKIGSNVLTRKDGSLDVTRMSSLVDQVSDLRSLGIEVLLVSSGAVASGRSELKGMILNKMDSVEERQLYSAVGQAKLINRYYELFRDHGIRVGQVLTMKENFSTRQLYLNQRGCIDVMLSNGVVPIINENDTVSVTELMFTDNDELSGLIATMMCSDALVILSNIDGLFTSVPGTAGAELIRRVEAGRDISSYISTVKSGFGRGGMQTKGRIAGKVAQEGIPVIIANGKRDDILVGLVPLIESLAAGNFDVESDVPCTLFMPSESDVSSVKKWIAHSDGFTKGAIHLNGGATEKVCGSDAASILPVGVTAVDGDFDRHDIIGIYDVGGNQIGVGRSEYDSTDARNAIGRHGMRPIVHYDFLYLV